MPDWNLLVREQLKGDVGLTQHDEIVAELAGHLEDRYDELRAEGAAESEAIEGALSEVTDWSALARRIRHAKRNPSAMNERTPQLWLPGLASLTAANLLLMLLSYMSLRPREVAELSSAWFPGLALICLASWRSPLSARWGRGSRSEPGEGQLTGSARACFRRSSCSPAGAYSFPRQQLSRETRV